MHRALPFLPVIALLVRLFSWSEARTPGAQPLVSPTPPSSDVGFFINAGQVRDQYDCPRQDVAFFTSRGGLSIFGGGNTFHYQFARQTCTPDQALDKSDHAATQGELVAYDIYRIDLELIGGNPSAIAVLGGPKGYYENFYNVSSAPQGITHVRQYSNVTLRDVYPGIDCVFHFAGNQPKHDFVVHPGADPSVIRIRITGADSIRFDQAGAIRISTPLGIIRECPPVSIQQGQLRKTRYLLQGDILSFNIRDWEHTSTLTIDPVIDWFTYYGGSAFDRSNAVACDDTGHPYMAGMTTSVSSIATVGAFSEVYAGGNDAFVARFDSMGSRLWATYLGGPDYDECLAVAVAGNQVVLGGKTQSLSSISSPGAFQPSYGGGLSDGFLVQLNLAGTRDWATYYGGNDGASTMGDYITSVAVGPGTRICIAGTTQSSSGIASPASWIPVYSGGYSGFVACFDGAGTRQWGTYLGAATASDSRSMAVTDRKEVIVAGYGSFSGSLATPGAYQATVAGSNDAFVLRFDSSGIRLWGTYFGGPSEDRALGVGLLPDRSVFLFGSTLSTSLIASPGAYQPLYADSTDMFICRFDSSGNRQWSTYSGGLGSDAARSAASDTDGNIIITGHTSSLSAISSPGVFQPSFGGDFSDVFLMKYNQSGTKVWGTYVGGDSIESGRGVAAFRPGCYYITGQAYGAGLATPGSFQPVINTGGDAFLARFPDPLCMPSDLPSLSISTDTICPGDSVTIFVSAADSLHDGTSWVLRSGSCSGPILASDITGSFTIAPPAGGVFFVRGEGACFTPGACASVNLFMRPAPLTGASFDTTVCAGDSVLLDAGSGYATYAWSNGATTSSTHSTPLGFEGDVPFGVSVTDSYGCSATWSVTVTEYLPEVSIAGDSLICPGTTTSLSVSGSPGLSWLWNTGFTGTLIASASPGTWWAAGTDAAGCAATDTFNLAFSPAISIDLGPDTVVCDGVYFTFSPGFGFASYLWSTGSTLPTITTLVSGTYWVRVTDAYGCTATDTVTRLVDPISITYVEANDTVCLDGGAFTLTMGSPPGGTYTGPGVTGTTFDPLVAGIGSHPIYYHYTDVYGCSPLVYDRIVVELCTGAALGTSCKYSVFPSPATDVVFIISSCGGTAGFEVVDCTGRIVLARSSSSRLTSLPMANLPSGVYFLRISEAGKTSTHKILVDRP